MYWSPCNFKPLFLILLTMFSSQDADYRGFPENNKEEIEILKILNRALRLYRTGFGREHMRLYFKATFDQGNILWAKYFSASYNLPMEMVGTVPFVSREILKDFPQLCPYCGFDADAVGVTIFHTKADLLRCNAPPFDPYEDLENNGYEVEIEEDRYSPSLLLRRHAQSCLARIDHWRSAAQKNDVFGSEGLRKIIEMKSNSGTSCHKPDFETNVANASDSFSQSDMSSCPCYLREYRGKLPIKQNLSENKVNRFAGNVSDCCVRYKQHFSFSNAYEVFQSHEDQQDLSAKQNKSFPEASGVPSRCQGAIPKPIGHRPDNKFAKTESNPHNFHSCERHSMSKVPPIGEIPRMRSEDSLLNWTTASEFDESHQAEHSIYQRQRYSEVLKRTKGLNENWFR